VFKLGPKEFRRALKRLGMNAEVKEVDDAERAIIVRRGPRDLVVENPQVTLLNFGGQTLIYIAGEVQEVEKPKEKEKGIEVPEEDVQLVASEAGVSLEEARAALVATGGDIARAILLLEESKKRR